MNQLFSITASIDDQERLTTEIMFNQNALPEETILGLSTIYIRAKTLLESLGEEEGVDLICLAESSIQSAPEIGEHLTSILKQ